MRTKRCTKCGQEQPLSEFHVNVAKQDGRCNWCKTCRNKTDRRRPPYPGDTAYTKTCRKCGQVKPRMAFARDGDRLDRRRSYCKQCEYAYTLAYLARKRAARANTLVAPAQDEHPLG